MDEDNSHASELNDSTEHQDMDDRQPKRMFSLKIIFVLGAPGAGKGTLCKKHPLEFGYYHLSVGDYLRDLCNKYDELPPEAYAGSTPLELRTITQEAKLLPAALMVDILSYKLQQVYSDEGNNKFVLDGFPRDLDSAKMFDEQVGRPCMVIAVMTGKDTARFRFLKRAREQTDSSEKFEARYTQYERQTPPILKHYESLIELVDTQQSVEEDSHARMLSLMKKTDSSSKLSWKFTRLCAAEGQ